LDHVWSLQKELVLLIMPMKNETILISHGAGGKQTRKLIEQTILKYFSDKILLPLPDAATVNIKGVEICFTTDSYVVNPVFFPGGDIGKLAICGTINDLAVSGAIPLFISCAMIIEEGFGFLMFEKILKSMSKIAKKTGVRIVTGDTKVVDRGKGDGIFITTTGIGLKFKNVQLGKQFIKKGDAVIIGGVPGMHELSIICARENIKFKTGLKSDCAPLHQMIEEIFGVSKKIRFMRDPTRGGVSAVLNEIVSGSDFGIEIYEDKIPLTKQVRSICEILGFDILNLASEGNVVIIADSKDANSIVRTMRKNPVGKNASVIGFVTDEFCGKVILKTKFGSSRFIEMPAAGQLPRIC